MHHRLSKRAGATALLVIAGLLGTLIAAPAAPAATINACKKKKGGTIRIVASKTKCRKTEKRIRWSTRGPAGANGTNGINGISGTNGTNGAPGTNGTNGAAGQPQKAYPFSVQSDLDAVTPIVTIGDLSLRMVCGPYVVANPLDIQATAPSGSTANTGMTITRSNVNQTPPDTPQRRIHNANVTTNTGIVTLTTNSAVDTGSRGNLGHVTGTITTPTQVVLLTANIKAHEAGPSACSVRGSAFGIPR